MLSRRRSRLLLQAWTAPADARAGPAAEQSPGVRRGAGAGGAAFLRSGPCAGARAVEGATGGGVVGWGMWEPRTGRGR
eukprot:scaffold3392_cov278-Prasinococcus_capsulatus_cf.AAC.2